jgi:hypothetical protein
MTHGNIKYGSNRVSEDVRRAHSKAIRQRDQWRERYAALSKSIRRVKQKLKSANQNCRFDQCGEMELRALRHYADIMMFHREEIKNMLRDTAYEYVDDIAV